MSKLVPCVFLGLSLAVSGGGCGDDSGGGNPDAAAGNPDAPVGAVDATPSDAFVPPSGSYTVQWGPKTVQPGEENTQCVFVKLGNLSQVHIGQFHNVLSGGSHHFIVYRLNTGTENTTPTDCQPFTGTLDPSKGAPIMITQRADEVLTLPQGVAFTMQADQLIRLEMHYINTTDQPVDVKGTSTFVPIADADFQNEADFLFAGSVDIDIPPNSTQTVGPKFIALPAEFNGVKFFGLTGHAHHFGTNVRVWMASDVNDASQPVYDVQNWKWNEPETVHFDPARDFTKAGFRIICDYNNTSASTVKFGESANDEMCFFWGYYYPSHGSRVCFQTSQTGNSISACCPGSTLCSVFQ
jgi:hypothetical protein